MSLFGALWGVIAITYNKAIFPLCIVSHLFLLFFCGHRCTMQHPEPMFVVADKGFPSALGLAAQRAGWRFSQNWLRSWLSRARAWFPGLCFHYTDAFSKQDLNTALSCLCSRAAFDCFRVFWVISSCILILLHYSYLFILAHTLTHTCTYNSI